MVVAGACLVGGRRVRMECEFRKAGTCDSRRAMVRASGRDLNRCVGTWIYGSAVPRGKFSSHVTGGEALVRFEQPDEPVDVALTVTVTYQTGEPEAVVVPLADKVTERTIAIRGPVRSITANADSAALVELVT